MANLLAACLVGSAPLTQQLDHWITDHGAMCSTPYTATLAPNVGPCGKDCRTFPHCSMMRASAFYYNVADDISTCVRTNI